eukprot:8291455-Pyramimonas_sp.AAC.1
MRTSCSCGRRASSSAWQGRRGNCGRSWGSLLRARSGAGGGRRPSPGSWPSFSLSGRLDLKNDPPQPC